MSHDLYELSLRDRALRFSVRDAPAGSDARCFVTGSVRMRNSCEGRFRPGGGDIRGGAAWIAVSDRKVFSDGEPHCQGFMPGVAAHRRNRDEVKERFLRAGFQASRFRTVSK